MSEDKPRVSIIVVNWNVRDLLRDCLTSVRASTAMPEGACQVIVVDNASADGSVAMLNDEFPWVQTIANTENIGFGRANNQALAHCRADIVLLLNPDTVVYPGALDAMVAAMEADPSIGVLGCRLVYDDGRLQRWTAGRYPSLWSAANHFLFLDRILAPLGILASMYLSVDHARAMDVDWVTGACLAIRREAAGDTLFDEQYFMYGEDVDLCHRVKQAGWRIVYDPTSTILHYHGASTNQQDVSVSSNALRGPRLFFVTKHGAQAVPVFDAIVTLGFALRYAIFSLAVLARPGYGGRRAANRKLLGIAWRLMLSNGKS
jgi:GT2 family glycosyltransferase